MSRDEQFQPDWTSTPGETIMDVLREREISEADFADLMALSVAEADDLFLGRKTVTIGLARRLTEVLGSSVEFWMSRDYQYRRDSRRLQEDEEQWLRRLPIGDMIRFGWLTPAPTPSEELDACLRFFEVSSLLEWWRTYGSTSELAAFRSSPSFESRQESVAAWLRQGEIEAQSVKCGPWNPDGFQDSLKLIRSFSRQKHPRQFIPALVDTCSESGVAVVVIRSPSGCRASGATRFIAKDKAVLQLSFRHLTDDHFWFTFFHEAGHLVLHGQRDLFSATFSGQSQWIVESDELPETEDELEANEFAANTLIGEEFRRELLSIPRDSKQVIRFARRVGVSPGIVVGQLQHHGLVGYDQLNSLKRRFTWAD